MSKIGSTQHEIILLKKIIESKDPELLVRVDKELFGNTELSKIYNLMRLLVADYGTCPGFDLLSAELSNRVTNPEKQKFYVGLVEDIQNKDATGISTDDLIKALGVQKQFRVIMEGASKLVDAVEKRDADDAVGTLKTMYEEMYKQRGETLDDGDMCSLAGRTVRYNFHKVGIPTLDAHGFLSESSLCLIGAPSKAGKSIMALQFLMYGHDNYEGSSYLASYELSQGENRQRILSARSDVNIGLITSGMTTPAQKVALREAEVSHLCDFNENMRDYIRATIKEPDEEFFKGFWDHYKSRSNKMFLPARPGNWDELLLNMRMMAEMRNVKTFCIDYINLVPRGRADAGVQDWQYLLNRSRDLKTFARNNDCRIITPVQIDEKEGGKIRWGGGLITDADSMITIQQEDGDKEYGEYGGATISFRAMRNFQTVPGVKPLQPFKVLRQFDVCKFAELEF